MELGGHAPVLVFEDADPQYAGDMCARFKFRNCGQVCASPSRFYAHESIYEAFCDAFAKTASSLKVGPGLDPETQVGPMANARGLSHAKALIDDAVAKGARLLTGGKRPEYLQGDQGFYIEPTVLADVPAKANITTIEPFAPVAPIMKFSTFEEAIALANSTSYGLASYLFTNSLKTASLASERIEAGMVSVNDMAIAAAEMPFGGVKESGMGREGGSLGIRDYLEPKYVRMKLL
jgi:succinate-semialdehyde dehydrogenase/glutarate-semialdehyde dehydrogenase